MARIGLLALALPKDLQLPDLLTPALNALGWREGETCQIEARSANGDIASLPRLAAELVALRPDILIGIGSGETKALQSATSEIPILFVMSSDPVGYGLVDSIARPGRNTTGTSITPQILWGKRLELTAELLGHQPTKVAWIGNPDEVSAKRNLAVLMQSAEKLGVKVERLEVRKPPEGDGLPHSTGDLSKQLSEPLEEARVLKLASGEFSVNPAIRLGRAFASRGAHQWSQLSHSAAPYRQATTTGFGVGPLPAPRSERRSPAHSKGRRHFIIYMSTPSRIRCSTTNHKRFSLIKRSPGGSKRRP